MHDVVLDSTTTTIQCSCLLFEFRCIMCYHCLLTLGQEDIKCVPQKNVIRRWFKIVRRRHNLIIAGYNGSNDDPRMQRYQLLCKRFYDIVEVACDSNSASNMLCNELNSITKSLGVPTKVMPFTINDGGGCQSTHDVTPSITNKGIVHSSIQVKRKGRPRLNRMQSTVEKISKKKKTMRVKTKRLGLYWCVHIIVYFVIHFKFINQY